LGRCRVVLEGASDAYSNLALEEAIFVNNGRDALTLRIWNNERSVIIGRAQLAHLETDVDFCRTEGIPIVRRFTGGGAVYHGPGNLNWSISVGRDFRAGRVRYAWDAKEAFRVSASLVASAVTMCGTEVSFEGPGNRLVSSQGKVSGMAAYLSKEGMFCHGTLLLHADLGEAARLTDPAKVETERKYTRSNPMRVANIGVEPDRFVASMSAVVSEETRMAPEASGPDVDELNTMQSMLPRYRDDGWNLGDPFAPEKAY
jgi:lipoate---protein ligase